MFSIGLDLRATEAGFKAHYGRGTWRYVSQLVKALDRMSVEDIAFKKLYRKDLSASPYQQKILDLAPCGRQTLEGQLFLPSRLKKLDLNAIHFFAHVDAPSFFSPPQIISVLDLIPLKFKKLYTVSKGKLGFNLARHLEGIAIKKALGIVTISECSKRDIIELLGIPEHKIFVTPLAVSEEFSPREISLENLQDQQDREREHFNLPKSKPLILYVGGIDARKNIGFMLEVFADVRAQVIEQKPELILAGAYHSESDYAELKSKIAALGLESCVRELGFVPDKDLPSLYRACTCSIFPSLYEGFGFPVLESMACGVPVLAANNSSIPEVVGSDYLLLEDSDKRAWVSELSDLINSKDRQLDLSAKGIKQAQNFSWQRTAEKTVEAYRAFRKLVSVV